jgi:DNA processing protein
MDPKAYWVAFNLVKGIGAVRMRAVLDAFEGDLEAAWRAPGERLRAAGLSPRIVENLTAVRKRVDLAEYWDKIRKLGIRVITWNEDDYPRRLLEINQPPPVIYLRGTLTPEDGRAVAIVGTRRITAYGRQVSEDLATFLALNGVTVVSGLARGVDAVAHAAAVKAGGRSLAVMGCGVERIYPPEHRQLAEQLIAHGGLLSDYAPGTPPESANFPPRNRIISGLAMATVVVEAGEESGALITATFAGEQGREVFAVPGSILAPQSRGCNRLIAEGAHPLLTPQDVLDVLKLDGREVPPPAMLALPADEIEARLLQVVGSQPLHVDDIRAQSGLPIEKVTAALAIMELKGMVKQVGGMHYVGVREEMGSYEVEA